MPFLLFPLLPVGIALTEESIDNIPIFVWVFMIAATFPFFVFLFREAYEVSFFDDVLTIHSCTNTQSFHISELFFVSYFGHSPLHPILYMTFKTKREKFKYISFGFRRKERFKAVLDQLEA